jgi:hypothetical protein
MQQQQRLRQRRKQKNKAEAAGAPFLGFIIGPHDPDNERVRVQYHGGERKLRTAHPYTGSDSWIRAGAQASQNVILAQRPDSDEPEILSYAFRQPEVRIQAYKDGAGLYRPLTPGELEIHSRGAAQSFYSRRPLLEQRAGLIRAWLDQDELQSGAKAPIHVRNLHLHKGGEIGDEERFGVVQRPDGSTFLTKYISADRSPDPTLVAGIAETAATSGIIVDPGPFAKEHLRVLKTGALFPEKLLDVREGDVMDDEGAPINLSLTGKPLRYKGEWFTDDEREGVFFVGIDNKGNFAIAAPDEAETGGDLKIPMGDLVIYVGVSEVLTVQKDYARTTVDGQMTIDCKTDYTQDIREGDRTVTVHQGDHDTTVSQGTMNIWVDTGDRNVFTEGAHLHEVAGDITIKSGAAIHIIVGGTEIHIEDGLIELGAEGASDIAVLNSLLQGELGTISMKIGTLRDDLNNHAHALDDFIIPLIPIDAGPVTANPQNDPGEAVHPELISIVNYSPGDTASGLVTIDS